MIAFRAVAAAAAYFILSWIAPAVLFFCSSIRAYPVAWSWRQTFVRTPVSSTPCRMQFHQIEGKTANSVFAVFVLTPAFIMCEI